MIARVNAQRNGPHPTKVCIIGKLSHPASVPSSLRCCVRFKTLKMVRGGRAGMKGRIFDK